MAGIKSLFRDTAIYGLSSIVGRFLNWCLVPIYTYYFSTEDYGIVTNLYAYVALVLIILIYGMETGFFRFANHDRWSNPGQVYTTTLTSVGFTSMLFIVAGCLLSPTLARFTDCAAHPSYIWMMVVAVGVDAYTSIPFAYLRYRKRPVRFATLKIVNISLNIGLNLFFIVACPIIWRSCPEAIGWFYDPTFGIGYIFLSNLISSVAVLVLLVPEIMAEGYDFNMQLLRQMLRYSYPILLMGIAGIMNQTIDKILYPILVPDTQRALAELGVYGANYKIAIVMVMFIQAFRFAYEPFVFSKAREEQGEARSRAYVDAMTWFVVFAMFIFLGVMFYLPALRYFISPEYFAGLSVVPIVMMAEFFFGVFFNLSLWYKITDKTIWGTWFSLLGLVVTLVLNILFVPRYGYMACAWAAFCCYFVMMAASYAVGRVKSPIPYKVGRVVLYVAVAMVLWGVSAITATGHNVYDFATRFLLLGVYLGVVFMLEVRPRRAARTVKP